jgi:hypothetical protein
MLHVCLSVVCVSHLPCYPNAFYAEIGYDLTE